MTEWATLRRRFGRPDKMTDLEEWFMPLDDSAGIAAWRKWAKSLGGRFDGTRGQEGVAWDFPVVASMKAALSLAEAQLHGYAPEDNPTLARVVADLRSCRDTGYSSKSPEKPVPPLSKAQLAAIARKRRVP